LLPLEPNQGPMSMLTMGNKDAPLFLLPTCKLPLDVLVSAHHPSLIFCPLHAQIPLQ